jgi:hypothetical protein
MSSNKGHEGRKKQPIYSSSRKEGKGLQNISTHLPFCGGGPTPQRSFIILKTLLLLCTAKVS